MEGFLPGFASVRRDGRAEIGDELLKNGCGNCPYGAFLRLCVRFRAAKTEFLCGKKFLSCRKDGIFLPQRNSRACGKRGKTGLLAAFSFWLEASRVQNPFVLLQAFFPHGLTRGRHPSARRPVPGGKVSRKPGLWFSSCVPASSRDSRVYIRPRPCVRPCDSRGGDFDVLTKWHFQMRSASM